MAFPTYTRTPREPTIARGGASSRGKHWVTRRGRRAPLNLLPPITVQCQTLVMVAKTIDDSDEAGGHREGAHEHCSFERFPGSGTGFPMNLRPAMAVTETSSSVMWKAETGEDAVVAVMIEKASVGGVSRGHAVGEGCGHAEWPATIDAQGIRGSGSPSRKERRCTS